MRRWLFASERGTITHVEADPVVGGRSSIVEHLDGERIDHLGEYLLAERPHRLAFTLEIPNHFAETTQVELAGRTTCGSVSSWS